MASTNKTTHYELSQYVGSDKPTYLTDYNNDMSAIDTGIYNAQTKADTGYNLANTADGKADTAITNAGSAQTDASTALTRIGTLANLDTTEKTNLVGAINEAYEKLNPVVLYSDPTGTTGTVTLSQSAVNFSYIEILFDAGGEYNSVKVHNPNGKTAFLMTAYMDTNILGNIKFATVNISGTSITKDKYTALSYSNTSTWSFEENGIAITDVLGYY